MKQVPKYKVSFPHMGDYHVALKDFAGLISDDVLVAPPITKRTLELGSKHSPESVCIPFKYNLGNYIEALDQGANFLVQAGGGCRFGFYGEVQEQILRDLGYEFEFIKIQNKFKLRNFYGKLKKGNPKLTYREVVRVYKLTRKKCEVIEKIDDFVRKNLGFETKKGSFENLFKGFLGRLGQAKTLKEVGALEKEYQEKFNKLGVKKPKDPVRVGIVGELYVVMEPFSNFFIERELAKKGIEVHRFVTLTGIIDNMIDSEAYEKHSLELTEGRLKYHIGADGTESVAMTYQLIKKGFDGVIHIKPFGCMPEVNAMSILNRLSKEFRFPIVHLSFDTQTSETGIATRLEAFADMLEMKKKARGSK